jgi:hypothetical protein
MGGVHLALAAARADRVQGLTNIAYMKKLPQQSRREAQSAAEQA